jgi:hypothetical protein
MNELLSSSTIIQFKFFFFIEMTLFSINLKNNKIDKEPIKGNE